VECGVSIPSIAQRPVSPIVPGQQATWRHGTVAITKSQSHSQSPSHSHSVLCVSGLAEVIPELGTLEGTRA
jgi:hypothetical protein